jgi:CheY-like chemotaxis protein
MANLGIEKRKNARLRVKIAVMINGSVMADALDISEGGMFIHTSTPYPEGTELRLSFTPGPGCSPVNVLARVQFLHTGLAIGVVFLNLDEMDMDMIKKYVESGMEEDGLASEGVAADARKKILIADGSPPARMMAKNTLMLKGFAVSEAENCVDALKAIEVNKPDLLIIDALMDGMNGEKFMHMLRSHDEWKDVQVVLMAGNMNPDNVAKLAVFGVAAILPKMMTTPKKLAEKVEEILGKND